MIQRGSICWADLGEARGSRPAKRRPVLVIQSGPFNASRLNTTIAAVITSNTALAVMPGNVFVVRVAGNFLTDDGLGSIEYSVATFKSPLILVLGHSACGAIKATVEFVKNGTKQPGNIQSLIDALATSARETKGSSDWVAAATASCGPHRQGRSARSPCRPS